MKNDQGLKVGLVFDDSLDTNDGVSQYVKNLGGWLSRNGHNVCYLVGQTDLVSFEGSKVYSLSRNFRVNFNGNRLSIPLFSKRSDIKHVLSQEDFDILHIMVPYSPFMAQKIIKSAKPKTALIGTFHIYPSGKLSIYGAKILKVLNGASLKRFFAIVSVSQPAASFAKKVFKISTPIIPNPVNISNFKPSNTPAKALSDTKIIFLGRLVKRKGCRELILAFSEIVNDFPALRLIIAGDGPDRAKLESLATELAIADRTDFIGYIDEKDKPSLLAEATIACFPALYGESFGLVLIEAMAAGSEVVIGGDNPGYASVLAGRAELLVNPADKNAFANRLRMFLNDENRRHQISLWQQKEVQKYDIEKIGPDILKLYFSAIASVDKNGHNKSYE